MSEFRLTVELFDTDTKQNYRSRHIVDKQYHEILKGIDLNVDLILKTKFNTMVNEIVAKALEKGE